MRLRGVCGVENFFTEVYFGVVTSPIEGCVVGAAEDIARYLCTLFSSSVINPLTYFIK